MKDKVIEFLEQSNFIEGVIDGLDQAVYAWKYIIKEKKLSPSNIKKTHKILMLHQPLMPDQKGYFRKCQVWVGGKETIPYFKIPEQMKIWCNNVHFCPKHWRLHHVDFERIHPFVDGNGRVGRILMNWQRLKKGLDILIIKEEEKQKYYSWFR